MRFLEEGLFALECRLQGADSTDRLIQLRTQRLLRRPGENRGAGTQRGAGSRGSVLPATMGHEEILSCPVLIGEQVTLGARATITWTILLVDTNPKRQRGH